jgi:hypothetical protein
MTERNQMRVRALALFAAPVAMLAAIIFHPYLKESWTSQRRLQRWSLTRRVGRGCTSCSC